MICNSLIAQQQSEIDSLERHLATVSQEEKTEILNRLSMIYQNISLERSIEYDLRNLKLNRELGHKKNQSTILNNLAISYYISGRYYKSIENFEQSLVIFEDFNDTLAIMKTLNNLGVLTQTIGKYDKALDYLQRSLTYKLNRNDTTSIAKTLNNIGVIYMDIGKTNEAKKFFNQAFNYYIIRNDKGSIADLYNNIGQLYSAEGKSDSALAFYHKSLDIKNEVGDEQGAGNTLNNIGILYSEKNMNDEAIWYLKEAQEIRKKIGDIYGLASTINNLANLYLAKANYKKALELYNSSNDIALKKELFSIVERNYSGMSKIFEQTGDFSLALKYFKLQDDIKDSIYTEDFNKQLADLHIQYEVEQNAKENKILRQKNQIQDLQISLYTKQKTLLIIAVILIIILGLGITLYLYYLNKKKNTKQLKELNYELKIRVKERTSELEKANKTKDQFLSIIAHDLKTPFNSVLGFSEILSSDFDKIDDRKRRELAELIYDSGKNIYKLLENLLEWASIQNGNIKLNISNINLKDMVVETINTINVQANKKNIKIRFVESNDYLAFGDENSVKTVLRNIISNSIKFTSTGGMIEVRTENYSFDDKEYLKISVKDNGEGISETNLEKIFNINKRFRSEGTENEPGTGLGLILCKAFITKNNGKIWAESKLGEGSTFSFILPKSQATPVK